MTRGWTIKTANLKDQYPKCQSGKNSTTAKITQTITDLQREINNLCISNAHKEVIAERLSELKARVEDELYHA
jgi:hypothetical protein